MLCIHILVQCTFTLAMNNEKGDILMQLIYVGVQNSREKLKEKFMVPIGPGKKVQEKSRNIKKKLGEPWKLDHLVSSVDKHLSIMFYFLLHSFFSSDENHRPNLHAKNHSTPYSSNWFLTLTFLCPVSSQIDRVWKCGMANPLEITVVFCSPLFTAEYSLRSIVLAIVICRVLSVVVITCHSPVAQFVGSMV